MAAPVTQFREIPNNTATTAVDTPGKRRSAISGEVPKSTGPGQEVDYGTLDISVAAQDSAVKTLLWNVTSNGGNTTVDTWKLWVTEGFDIAASETRFRALSGADETTPTNTENYAQNATTSSYTFAKLPETEPGSANMFPPSNDSATSIDITTIGLTDDAIMWAMYVHVETGETTGTYKGTDAGNELQYSFKFSFS